MDKAGKHLSDTVLKVIAVMEAEILLILFIKYLRRAEVLRGLIA